MTERKWVNINRSSAMTAKWITSLHDGVKDVTTKQMNTFCSGILITPKRRKSFRALQWRILFYFITLHQRGRYYMKMLPEVSWTHKSDVKYWQKMANPVKTFLFFWIRNKLIPQTCEQSCSASWSESVLCMFHLTCIYVRAHFPNSASHGRLRLWSFESAKSSPRG